MKKLVFGVLATLTLFAQGVIVVPNNVGASYPIINQNFTWLNANKMASPAPASQVIYTAPGGGSSRTVSDQLSDYQISVKSFGAVGDYNGSSGTDNCTAITNALAAVPLSGGRVFFPVGNYYTSCGFTVTNPTVIIGVGVTSIDLSQKTSQITSTSSTGVLFTVTAETGRFEDIALVNSSSIPPTAGAGIFVTGSYIYQQVSYDKILVSGFYDNIHSGVGQAWHLRGSQIMDAFHYGVFIENTVNSDAGDWFVSDNFFSAGSNSALAAIYVKDTGGGKIINNKIVFSLNRTCSGPNAPQCRFADGIRMDSDPTLSEELLVTANDIDQVTGIPINIISACPYISIQSNFLGVEFGSGPAIYISKANSTIIGGNVLKNGTGSPLAAAVVYNSDNENSVLLPSTLQGAGFTAQQTGMIVDPAVFNIYNNLDYSNPVVHNEGRTTSGPILTSSLGKNGVNGDFIGFPIQLPTSGGVLKRVGAFSVVSSGVGASTVGATACVSSGTDAGLANGFCTDPYGRWLTQGTLPSCTDCSVSGTDSFGTIQSSGSTFTLTFANAWASSPACMMVTSNYAVQPLYSWSTSAITVSNSITGAEYIYACVGTAPLPPAW